MRANSFINAPLPPINYERINNLYGRNNLHNKRL